MANEFRLMEGGVFFYCRPKLGTFVVGSMNWPGRLVGPADESNKREIPKPKRPKGKKRPHFVSFFFALTSMRLWRHRAPFDEPIGRWTRCRPQKKKRKTFRKKGPRVYPLDFGPFINDGATRKQRNAIRFPMTSRQSAGERENLIEIPYTVNQRRQA